MVALPLAAQKLRVAEGGGGGVHIYMHATPLLRTNDGNENINPRYQDLMQHYIDTYITPSL